MPKKGKKKIIGVTDPLVIRTEEKLRGLKDTRPTTRVRRDLDLLEVWIAGMRKEIPSQLSFLIETVEAEEDPEYAEYLRLKEKFE